MSPTAPQTLSAVPTSRVGLEQDCKAAVYAGGPGAQFPLCPAFLGKAQLHERPLSQGVPVCPSWVPSLTCSRRAQGPSLTQSAEAPRSDGPHLALAGRVTLGNFSVFLYLSPLTRKMRFVKIKYNEVYEALSIVPGTMRSAVNSGSYHSCD